jgi:transglutaminase-like putative cysteine protease
MKYHIVHRTQYTYAAPVKESFNEVRLKPVSLATQTVDSFLLKVLPATRLRHYLDFYSNCVHHFEIPEPHPSLLIESQLSVTTRPPEALPPDATSIPLAGAGLAASSERCFDFVQASRFVELSPEVWRLAVDATNGHEDLWHAAQAIMRFVHGHLTYEPRSTTVHTHMRAVLESRQGVCQDYAHVMLGLCRALRIPALYVSGYLATETASATHAWVEVFVPNTGWQALDPTHNRQPDETYIKLAIGRDYSDVSPVSGNYKGTQERKMAVEVTIRQVQ